MIGQPHNDRACLGAITRQVVEMVEARDPALVAIAEQHEDTASLAAWLRSLPQRDDDGDPDDGPKVEACQPVQRLRIPADDPNCVERSALYLGVAELLDPQPWRRLATVDTPAGLHTFLTEDNRPVILDPHMSRNGLAAALFHSERNAPDDTTDVATRRLRLQRLIGLDETKGVRGDLARARAAKERGHTTWVDGRPIDEAIAIYEKALATCQARLDALPRNVAHGAGQLALTPDGAIDWIAEIAVEPAVQLGHGARRIERAHRAMRAVLAGRPLRMTDVEDVALLLALAEREARLWGQPAVRVVWTVAHVVDQLDQAAARRWLAARAPNHPPRNALELRIGRTRIAPDVPLLASLGRVGGRLGARVGIEAARLKLAALGVTPPVLQTIERELNREGLTMGPLAAPPPMLGSLASLTPEALAGRWLADKL